MDGWMVAGHIIMMFFSLLLRGKFFVGIPSSFLGGYIISSLH